MITSPTNKLIVKVAKNWIKNPTDVSRVSAAADENTSVDLADYVQIVGDVVSLPKSISPHNEYKGYSTKDIKEGDVVIFSYLVLHDTKRKGDEWVYANAIYHEGQEYFLADIKHIFAVIRGEEIIMVNGWVMLNQIEEDKIIVPAYIRNAQKALSSEILFIGHSRTHLPPISAQAGDMAFFPKNRAQKYELAGKKFLILPQEKILGIKR